ncbi:DUF6596 domain-containing protein [Streptomyces sp. NPDC059513]|uniref:DUF6596 domain-containing protein n=1 Tax=unclassified Streptomyces TaxID=2593676 RepID=UPI00369692C3
MTALLALMVLTEARTSARTGPDGELIPLDEQGRALWDRTAIAEGTALAEEALAQGPAGDYQLQAAIAALHDEAERAEDTGWPQILALYELLVHRTPGPAAALGRAVAVAMVHGPRAGPVEVDALAGCGRGTSASLPYEPISGSGQGSWTPPAPPIARPPTAPSVSPGPATCACGRTGWFRSATRPRRRTGTSRARARTPFSRSPRGHRRDWSRRRRPPSRSSDV